MNAVSGRRMNETVTRRGGLTVLPQDIPYEVLEKIIKHIKNCHTFYETALTLSPQNTINEALNIIHKRAHGAIIIVDDKQKPVGIFTEDDAAGSDRFTALENVMTSELIVIDSQLKPKEVFDILQQNRLSVAPVVSNGKLVGAVTLKGTVRSEIYKPALDKDGKLLVATALGINGDVAAGAQKLLEIGTDILVLDTAHGHQAKMINAIKTVRSISKHVLLVAGNVVSAEAVKQLVAAGADVVKVGIGPGAMCTTRMMTGVGRPQFSAVLECSDAAHKLGAAVWADGGIRYPRDVALALAAGADNVMWGSMWAGTYESPGDVHIDAKGRLYKQNFGMASRRAVKNRNKQSALFERHKKEFFEEGISSSKYYLDPDRPSAEDIIDYITAGIRSSFAYAGAKDLKEFHQKAIVGIQSAAGYQEGMALENNW